MSIQAEDLDFLENVQTAPVVHVRKRRISTVQKIAFFSNLARLLRGGVPLLRALDLTASGTSLELRQLILGVRSVVSEGQSLSDAFACHPHAFGEFEVSVIRAGEASATVPETLFELASQFKKQIEIRSKLINAVSYPSFVLVMGVVTLFSILIWVIPRMGVIYENYEGNLPLVTRGVMAASSTAPWLLGALVAASLSLGLWLRAGNPVSKQKFVEFLFSLPLVNDLRQKQSRARFSLLLSTLLKSGVHIGEAIGITAEAMPRDKKSLTSLYDEVSHGGSLYDAFGKVSFFSEHERSLILASEESGTVPEALQEIADHAMESLTSSVNFWIKVLEPALILVIGGIVGLLVVSLILPITDLSFLAGE